MNNCPYRLDPLPLGFGGFSEVFRGVHRDSGLVAAIKRPLNRPEAQARFAREVDVQSQLQHPHVMPIIDGDAEAGWFAMPMARWTLAQARTTRAFRREEVRVVLRHAGRGLSHAHSKGFVHRDVTPTNILFVGDRWVVADWGLVRRPLGESSAPLTRGGLGTLGFLAPELADEAHEAATPRSDIYSLGRVTAWLVRKKERPWRLHWPADDESWSELVESTTAENPGDRPGSMEEVINLAEAVPREGPVTQGLNECLQCGHSLQGIWCPRCGWSYNPGDR